jgi:hypothetical protein
LWVHCSGSSCAQINRRTGEHRTVRGDDGFWGDERRPRNRRVSATFITPKLSEWGIAMVNGKLWHHPGANLTMDPGLWSGTQVTANEATGELETDIGRPTWDILGVPERWPAHQGVN